MSGMGVFILSGLLIFILYALKIQVTKSIQ